MTTSQGGQGCPRLHEEERGQQVEGGDPQLGGLGLFSVGKRGLRGISSMGSHPYLQGGCPRGRSHALPRGAQCQDQSPWAHAGTQEGPSAQQETLFTGRVAQPWPRLPREVVESPSLEALKTTWTWSWATSSGGWTRWSPEVPPASAVWSCLCPNTKRVPPSPGRGSSGPRGGSEAPSHHQPHHVLGPVPEHGWRG